MPNENIISFDWRQVARHVMTSRIMDLVEEEELAPERKIKYQFSAKGHELVQVLLGLASTHEHDGATVYYRSRPFVLTSGLTPREAFAGNLALSGSASEGRETGVLYSLPPRNGPTVLPASGYVGAQFTPAVGWAQAIVYHQEVLKDESWQGAIALALGGDGAVASNGFWAALNIATTLNLPYLMVIEDNRFGISTPSYLQTPGGNIAENLASFSNLLVLDGSGIEPAETAELVAQGISHVRNGGGPCLLHLRVSRLSGHAYGEDQSVYKSQELIQEEESQDPVLLLKEFLGDSLEWDSLWEEISAEVHSALESALCNPHPDREEAIRHLFFDGQMSQVPGESEESGPGIAFSPPENDGPRINMLEAIRRVMDSELSANPKLLILGEDVGVRGGVHRATMGLYDKYGGERIMDTSLSEEGIVGRALGMALAGLRPLPEIQFRKYADPGTEQICDIGWLRWRTAGKFSAPVVIRMPVGPSKVTGDPYHSYNGEAIYTHSLGWRVAFPSNASDAAGLLRTALREKDPTIFLEHRAILDNAVSRRSYPGDDYMLPFGKAAIIQSGDTLTMVAWGEMVHRCIEAAKPFEGQVEIIDLRTLIPWDKETVLSSIAKTGKLIVAHEDNKTGGFAGEIVSTVVEEAFLNLDAPIQRVTSGDTPTPFNSELRDAIIPTVSSIREHIERLLEW